MDGAMGTELQRAGCQPDECGEIWNLTHPERVRAIHQAYVDAGAEVLLTNTFQANPSCNCRARRATGSRRVHRRWDAAERSRAVCVSNIASRLATSGPSLIHPHNTEFPDCNDVGQCQSGTRVTGTECPLERHLLETCSSPRGATSLIACGHLAEKCRCCFLDLSAGHEGQDRNIAAAMRRSGSPGAAKDWGVAALGVNCGRDIGMDEIIEIVRRYRTVTDLPLFARPNAGTPTTHGDRWVYPHTPESDGGAAAGVARSGRRAWSAAAAARHRNTSPHFGASFIITTTFWDKCDSAISVFPWLC